MTNHITHWIDGKLWTGKAARTGEVYNPATGKLSGTVDFASTADMDEAVAVATSKGRIFGKRFNWRRCLQHPSAIRRSWNHFSV